MKFWAFLSFRPRRALPLAFAVACVSGVAFLAIVRCDRSERGPASAGGPPAADGAPPGVAARATLLQRVTVSGAVAPRKRQDVKPPYNGYVAKIYVKTGDRVRAGDPLVTFSPSLARDDANYPIRAAFAGIVSQVLRVEGEYVAEQSEQNLVARVDDVSELYVQASVPELDVAKTKIGQEAMIRVAALGSTNMRGKIAEIALSAREKERWSSSSSEFAMRVTILDRDPRLMPGMTALMDVITAKRVNVLALAHEYVQQDSEGSFVTLASGEVRRVTLGLQTEEAVEIVAGLREGERAQPIDYLNLPKQAD